MCCRGNFPRDKDRKPLTLCCCKTKFGSGQKFWEHINNMHSPDMFSVTKIRYTVRIIFRFSEHFVKKLTKDKKNNQLN